MSTYLIKLGGQVLAKPESRNRLSAAIQLVLDHGDTLTIVHGAGPQATDLSKRLGIETKKIAGRRVTDSATLDVMKMTLGGCVSLDLTASLIAQGVRAWNLSGVTCRIVEAVKRKPKVIPSCGPDPIDFGLVGDVIGINTKPIELVLQAGYLPVINSLGVDENGQILNINADTISSAIAVALKVEKLISITDVPGVLKNVKDPSSRIPKLTAPEAKKLIENGTIGEGMIPKLETSLDTASGGLQGIHVLAIDEPDDLMAELGNPGSKGTFIQLR